MKTIDIKGRPYVTVSERVKALRNKYGFDVAIITEIHSLTENYVVIKAQLVDSENRIISTGYAKENQGDTFINKGSHIENCETSAVGRCLAFAGFGIDAEIASAEELINSDSNSLLSDGQRITIENMLQDCTLSAEIIDKIEKELDVMTHSRAEDCIEYLSNHIKDPVESASNYNQKDINRKLDEKLQNEKA